MIRLLVKLGVWLDARFPEKVIVKMADYQALQARICALEISIKEIHASAVHKEAVKDLVLVVKAVKDDFQSLKTSLGLNRQVNPELNAVLNGEYLPPND